MANVISANLDFDVYAWLMAEVGASKKGNVSKIVNFYLRKAKEEKQKIEPAPEPEPVFNRVGCPICGAVYSSKLASCPGCSMAEIEKREALITAESQDKQARKLDADKRLAALRQDLETQESKVSKCRELAKSVDADAWETSQEKKNLARALDLYNKTLREIYDLEAVKNEP